MTQAEFETSLMLLGFGKVSLGILMGQTYKVVYISEEYTCQVRIDLRGANPIKIYSGLSLYVRHTLMYTESDYSTALDLTVNYIARPK